MLTQRGALMTAARIIDDDESGLMDIDGGFQISDDLTMPPHLSLSPNASLWGRGGAAMYMLMRDGRKASMIQRLAASARR